MRRAIISAITAAALLTAATACGSSDADEAGGQAGSTIKVKFGGITIVDVAPLHLGIQKGFFTE